MRLPVPLKTTQGVTTTTVEPPTEGSKLAFITQADNLIKTQNMLITLHPLYKGDGNE